MVFTASPGLWTNSSDANFRAWGKSVSDNLTLVGLPKTADTGQIDWTTVIAPSGPTVYQGYEIRRFNDALQASAPIFFKIEYGESSGVDGPSVRIQFGTGSNGAGALTGVLSSQVLAGTAAVAASALLIGSGGPARFCMCGGFTAAGGIGQWFGFERTKDAAGNDTVEGLLWLGSGTATTPTAFKSILTYSGSLGDLYLNSSTVIPCLFPLGASFASGTQIGVAPVIHGKPLFMNPGLNFVGYFTENITPSGTPAVYMYGAPHLYFTLPANSAAAGAAFQGVGGGTEALALRYE